jgi:hypothetical protein
MKKSFPFKSHLCFLIVITITSTIQSQNKINGWFLAGATPQYYEIGTFSEGPNGNKVAYLRSTADRIDEGFGTLMQSFEPGDFLGKKVRLTGRIKAINIKDWSGMWMRIDGQKRGKRETLSFDNMYDRGIRGSKEWDYYEIVLEVPEKATGISYGVLINGTGEVLIDGFRFEVIDEDTETTGKGRAVLSKPTNTDFGGSQD